MKFNEYLNESSLSRLRKHMVDLNMITFKQFLVEHPLIIHEVKMSRVVKHFSQSSYPVGIITAFRGKYEQVENISRNKHLASTLKTKGYGYIWVDGRWIENRGTNKEIIVSDDSILVIGKAGQNYTEFSKELEKLAKVYDQEGYVCYNQNDNITYIIGPTGKILKKMIKFHIGEMEDGFTKLRGHGERSFYFEGFREPISWIGHMLLTDVDKSKNCI